MKADLSIMQTGIQIFSVFLYLLNIALYYFLLKYSFYFQKNLVKKIYRILFLLFFLPLIGLFIKGFHFIDLVPDIFLLVYIYPALVWHLTHIFLFIGFLFLSPLFFIYFCFKFFFFLRSKWKKIEQSRASKSYENEQKSYTSSSTNIKPQLSRKKFLQKAIITLPSLALFSTAFSVVSASRKVKTTRVYVSSKRFSGVLNKLKIAHFSDLHIGSFIRLKELSSIVDQLNSLKADLVVFTGDLCDNYKLLEATLQILGRIKAPLGVYACMGNHDYFLDQKYFFTLFNKSKVKMLVDDFVILSFNNEKFKLAGLDYNFERDIFSIPLTTSEYHAAKVLDGDSENLPTICLVHNPNSWDAIRKRNIVLTLAGHTHGGQFIFGKKDEEYISPVSIKFPRFYGHYKEDDTHLYVTSGAGNWLPLRINCPREIALITLQGF